MNPNKDDILIINKKKEKKNAIIISPEINKILKIKIYEDLKNSINKLNSLLEKKNYLLKCGVFYQIKNRNNIYSLIKMNNDNSVKTASLNTNSKIYRENTNLNSVHMCEICVKKLTEIEKKNFKNVNVINNKEKSKVCFKCSLNKNENKEESGLQNSISLEHSALIFYESKILIKKIHNNFQRIFNINKNKKKLFLSKYFNKWYNKVTHMKFFLNMKNEYDQKYSNKFEVKIQENQKHIKKLDKEKLENTIKNESLLQSIQLNTLKLNKSKEKEKSLNLRLKTLTNEKKKVMSDLQKNEANIDNKISNIQNLLKNMENKLIKIKEDKSEKNNLLNKYVDEMNDALDYYENKTSNYIEFHFTNKLTLENSF